MTVSPLIYIVAGEASGDQVGARLIRALKKKGYTNFAGVGGQAMIREGFQSFFPMKELSVMGIFEIIPHVPRILKRLRQTQKDILQKQPAVVVTIDSPGFCFRLAKKLHPYAIPLVHYTAPTVWAWRPKRAGKISKIFNHLLVLFPHEPPYFVKEGLPTTFVGHPLIEMNLTPERGKYFRQHYNFKEEEPLLCLLPGSRQNEIDRLLPVFIEALKLLKVNFPHLQIVMPTVLSLKEYVLERLSEYNLSILLITDQDDKIAAMAASDVALAASGTVALELALTETPTVIAYRINKLTALIVRRLLKTPYVCLTNILLGRLVVPELLQENCTPEKIYKALLKEMSGSQKKELSQIRALISPLSETSSDIAAREIIKFIKHKDSSLFPVSS